MVRAFVSFVASFVSFVFKHEGTKLFTKITKRFPIEATLAAPAAAAHSKVSDVFEISRVRRGEFKRGVKPVG